MALGSGGGASSGAVRAGGAFVELFVKNSLTRGLNDAAKTFKSFGNSIGNIGKAMALGGAAAFTPLIGAMGTLNDIAKQGSIAKSLGLTSEQFTGIAGVAKSVGNDTKEFIESLVTLGKLGTDAAAGTEQASAAFASMGLNANEFIKLRADEQFFKIFDALGAMESKQQSVRALMAAFGEDGGKILLPLLGKSSEELRKMASGFAITGDDMKAATGAQQAYATATTALSKAWQSVSIAAAPIVKILAEGIAQAVTPFREFVNANREAVVGLSLAAGGITAVGLGLMVLGPAIKALAGSWALFTGAVAVGKAVIAGTMAVIAAPILLIPAGLAAAGAAWLAFTDSGNAAVKGFAGRFSETFANLKAGWSGVVGAVQRGDLESAFKIGVTTLDVEWTRLTNKLKDIWRGFMEWFDRHVTPNERFDRWADTIGRFIDAVPDNKPGDKVSPLGNKLSPAFAGPPSLLAFGAMGAGNASASAGGFLSDRGIAAAADAKSLAEKQRLADFERATAGFRAVFASMKGTQALTAAGGGAVAEQIANIASRTMSAFGGSANVGMFGGGGDVGKQIAANTKATADGVKALLSTRRYNESTGITVAGGT